ncbi:NACHT domain-containing protein [Lentzea sp. HUAS TT2]|uniref:NACHT domain-containing protein n=1 Tax=Lentzea sp. HUAS TT2 TaxID=3447454 RepID=UPI003F720513
MTRLTYQDALKILGAGQSPLVSALDKVFGGLLLGTTPLVPDLLSIFDAKSELVRLTHELVAKGIDRRHRLGQFDRIQRLHAARGVLTVVAYFEALEDADLPFQLDDARISRSEAVGLATDAFKGRTLADVATSLLETDLPLLGVQATSNDAQEQLGRFYQKLNETFKRFLEGLSLWEELDATRQLQAIGALARVVPAALRVFDASLYRLAADCPEFAIWLDLSGQRGIRDGLDEVQEAVQTLLDRAEPVESVSPVLQGIVRFNRSALTRTLLPAEELPNGLETPEIGRAYVDPYFRLVEVTAQAPINDEDFWAQLVVRKDFDEFLLGHLSTPWAWTSPLVVLGHPGAGKSLLTEVQAARLPSPDFVSVRVPLRDVPAGAEIHEQIERAIRLSTHETVSWPDFARAAGDSLLVVLLDGFDELLQATGVSRSDYLVRVKRFQQVEETQGRHVAVIVTSRVTVADRMQIPAGVVAVRLEPFEIHQVEEWVEEWNETNESYLYASGGDRFDLDVIERYLDLARQPLLLLMLAIYHAESGGMDASEQGLSQTELYEQLVRRFAHREVSKKDSQAADAERELLILSVVAFGMFTRSAQWVTDAKVAEDLTALGITRSAGQVVTPAHQRLAGEAKDALGRFFYIHRARTMLEGEDLGTYEFLHATFGEFFVARLTWRCLTELVEQVRTEKARMFSGHRRVDDTQLRTFLSWALLSTRTTTLDFLSEMARHVSVAELRDIREALLIAFRNVHEPAVNSVYQAYRPLERTQTARIATYSANLLLLLMTVAEEVSSAELFPGVAYHADEWTRSVHLWMSQLRRGEWSGVTELLRADRARDPDENQSVVLSWRGSPSAPRAEPMWARNPTISGVVTDYEFGINFFRSAEFLCEWDTDVVVTALSGAGTLFTRLVPHYMHRDEQLRSVAADLLHASLFHVDQTRLEGRTVVYDRLVDFATGPYLDLDHVVDAELEMYLLQLLVNDELVAAEYVVDKVTGLAVTNDPRGPENLSLFLRLFAKADEPRWFLDLVERLLAREVLSVEQVAEIWCALADKGIAGSAYPEALLDEAHRLRWPAREQLLEHRPDLLARLSKLEDDELL